MGNEKLHIKKWENHKQLTVSRNVWSPSFGGLVFPLPGASSMRFFLLLNLSYSYRRLFMSHSSHKWIKAWTTILTDPDLDNVSLENIGRWVKLLLYVKMHGEKGILKMPEPARTFCNHMHIKDLNEFNEIAKTLPNVEVSCNGKNGVTIYTMKNWYKYQVDDSYERVEKHRETQKSVTPQEKIREDKKRKEKIAQNTPDNFLEKLKENPAYNGIDIDRELARMDAWFLTPRGIGRKKTKKFIVNWLNKIDVALPTQEVSDWRG